MHHLQQVWFSCLFGVHGSKPSLSRWQHSTLIMYLKYKHCRVLLSIIQSFFGWAIACYRCAIAALSRRSKGSISAVYSVHAWFKCSIHDTAYMCHWLCLQFWKENVEKFEEKDFQILRVLLKLLEASRETRTLAVGCHDLGMFITNHPHGRSIVTGTQQHLY